MSSPQPGHPAPPRRVGGVQRCAGSLRCPQLLRCPELLRARREPAELGRGFPEGLRPFGPGRAPANPGSPASPSRPPGRGWVATPPAGRDLGREQAVRSRPKLQAPLRFVFPPIFPDFSSGRISGTLWSPMSSAVTSPRPLLTVGLRRQRCGFFEAARGAAQGEAKPIFTDRQGNSRRGSLRSRGGLKGRRGEPRGAAPPRH